MARRVTVTSPFNFNSAVRGGLTGTFAGLIRFRTTNRGPAKVYVKNMTPAGNPKPTHRFPKGQSGNPKYRP